jgi:predicted component of type VI protein secretion system
MSDLVFRLRQAEADLYTDISGNLVLEAADRIAALEADLATAHTQCGYNQLTINALGERCTQLEAALRDIGRFCNVSLASTSAHSVLMMVPEDLRPSPVETTGEPK